MNKSLSVKETILYAVNALVNHPWYFIKLFIFALLFAILIFFATTFLPGIIFLSVIPLTELFSRGFIFVNLLVGLFFLLAFILYIVGLVYSWFVIPKMLLKFYDTQSTQVNFGQIFGLLGFRQLLRLLAVSILYFLAVTAGFIVLIIPGIYLAVKLQFAWYYVLDKNIGVIEAFKRSYAATTGNFWSLFFIDIIAAFLMNLIIAIPIAFLMFVYAYRHLD